MAKHRKTGQEEKPDSPTESTANRAKMRALIVSALAAGGVFQMNSWQIQAHGNRSSHSALAFQTPSISPDDYILLREVLTRPMTPDADQLIQINNQLRALNVSTGPAITEGRQKLLDQKRAVEERIGIPSTTRQVIQFLRQGDTNAAIASIEGQGWPERVLQDYQWVLLDIAYLDGNKGEKFTPTQRQDFLAIAKPALAYTEKVLALTKGRNLTLQEQASKERAAEIQHNVASFIVTMENAGDDVITFGQKAAERALEIRTELNQTLTIMRANWMVAQYHVRANRTNEALKFLSTSLRQAEQLRDLPSIAWTKHSMANALRGTSVPTGGRMGITRSVTRRNTARIAQLDAEVRKIVSQFKGEDTTIDFLRLELNR